MTVKKAQKPSRILALLHIFLDETDSTTGLSLPEIQERLAQEGISVERKALYRDLDALSAFGLKIDKMPGRPVKYHVTEHLFKPAEMMLLVDAVQSSRSITQENSKRLIRKLKRLCSKGEGSNMQSRVHVSGRVKMQNESVFQTLDQIQQAIAQKRDIAFAYQRYNPTLTLERVEAADGRDRVKTPLFIVYSGDKYYMLAYDEKSHDHLRSYRIDRMCNVLILDRSPKTHKADPAFDITTYERRTPGMFDKKPVRITLAVEESLIGNIVDIFGTEDVTCSASKKLADPKGADRSFATMTVMASPSPVLFGQIAQFGGDVTILKPASAANAYREHLEAAIKAQSKE